MSAPIASLGAAADTRSNRPLLLDLFCGAGGAGMGYHRAGFRVIGVDIEKQPHYPFEFHQADALTYPLEGYDAIHASPPCQAWTRARAVHRRPHPDLIPATRARLIGSGAPYVIENVELAPLRAQFMLCGTMFGLPIRRHRYFETNLRLGVAPADCNCRGRSAKGELFNPYNTVQRRRYLERTGQTGIAEALRRALGTPWIPAAGGASRKRGATGDISNAIPPAYTEWIGGQLMAYLTERRLVAATG